MLFLALIAAILLIDLGIKDTIEKTENDAFPKELDGTGGRVVLYKAHNPGLPFGRLANYPELVKQLPLAVAGAAAGIFLWLLPKKGDRLQKLGLAFVLGGAASNLYDRFKRGYVVDYLNVRVKKIREIIFNLADVCILIGAAVFLIGELIAPSSGKR